ncbi:DUF885 domain-containing protein [Brevibacterium samyangense]|uniref:DUF885 domain-containing protein n=1 Tax=Brevibacterium samyangense TaxID=366888 RepID=A0ABP5EL82_9MICO
MTGAARDGVTGTETSGGTGAGPDSAAPRTPSAVDAVAESFVSGLLDFSPALHVRMGVPGKERELDDFSPAAIDARDELLARTLADLDTAEDAARADGTLDAVDLVTLDAMRDNLGIEREIHAAGYDLGVLNVIHSPFQEIRDLFDLVPTASTEDWENNAARLDGVGGALAGHRESLLAARGAGRVPALRQVTRVAQQARRAAETGGHFDRFVAKAEGTVASTSLASVLASGAAAARQACADFADFLESELAPHARTEDAVGREEYVLHSRKFLGDAVDLEETYAWGLERLAAIDAEQREIAHRLYPGEFSDEDAVWGAMRRLDEDPSRTLHGLAGLRSWMQETADSAITALHGTHFDIPEPVRTIEAMVLPNGTGGIYYTGPSGDFSRPGRMWWSVPAGVEQFTTWQERTTVNHEGVPGHHLQIGFATFFRAELNSWRRTFAGTAGNKEGWALYAEKLMAELGFMDEPGDRMGMLDSQRLRAARVCLDIGVHLGLEAPTSLGGGTWNADKAWQFLTDNVAMDRNFLAFELDRYLGWPGQAPSYAIGQRLWENIRAGQEAAARDAGQEFSLKDFHMRALRLGPTGLGTLRRAFG